MGFSHSHFGLCCDFCGNSEPKFNVVKINCPYGWCQAWACCKNCKAKKLHLVCSIGNTHKSHKEICKVLALEHSPDRKAEQAFQEILECEDLFKDYIFYGAISN